MTDTKREAGEQYGDRWSAVRYAEATWSPGFGSDIAWRGDP